MVADSGSGAARCQGCAWEGAMDMSCALMLVSVELYMLIRILGTVHLERVNFVIYT